MKIRQLLNGNINQTMFIYKVSQRVYLSIKMSSSRVLKKKVTYKKVFLTVQQKQEIIEKFKTNPKITQKEIAIEYGVGKTQIQNTLSKKDLITDGIQKGTLKLSTKRLCDQA